MFLMRVFSLFRRENLNLKSAFARSGAFEFGRKFKFCICMKGLIVLNMSIRLKPLIVNLLIALGVGALSGFLTMGAMEDYKAVEKPMLSPPEIVFPIVWSVLYILMAVSAYLVYVSDSPRKRASLITYGVQLALNFLWPIVFFCKGAYLAAFFVLCALLITVIVMTVLFFSVRNAAGFLQIPYILWLLFAGYLNFGVYLLN